MANITKRTNKLGAVSYRIRVFLDRDGEGRQAIRSMTWTPPPAMRPTTAEKEANRQALLFEEKVRSGVVSIDGKTKFADYAERWLEAVELAPKTREQYVYLLERANKAIGHILLEKLRAEHLEALYASLRETGITQKDKAYSSNLAEAVKGMKLLELAEKAGVSKDTLRTARRGKPIRKGSAVKIAAALGQPLEPLFSVLPDESTLSDRTIWHFHKLIRAILARAKKSRIIPFNVASEHMDAPKLPRNEARYLNDDESRAFVAALMDETDIRVKVALILGLFTGLRRGDEQVKHTLKNILHINPISRAC